MARFIICKASAGSGKTYTLVRQFIETAISSANHLETRFTHILAITFTNKAANGMKSKIMRRLHSIVLGKEDRLVEKMAQSLSVSNDEVTRRCKVLESSILHHYSQLSVCTIDSFVHRLVRTFAHDLHLPMNFNVLIDNEELLKYLVDDLMSNVGRDGELTRMLCSFAESRMESGKNYNVEDQIRNLSKEIFKEECPKYLAQLSKMKLDSFIKLHIKLSAEIKSYESDIIVAARSFVEECSSKGLSMDDFPNKTSSVYAFFARIAVGNLSKINDSHVRVDNAYNDNRIWGKSTPEHLRGPLDDVLPKYRDAYETFINGISKYNTRKMLLADLYSLALLNRISKIKDDYYLENEIVHISEFNKRISDEIVGEPAPFIYERIGNHYYNYLIDEFQDTSKMQWQNFIPLLDEAMAHCFDDGTAEPGTQSLIVGDGKQAIYRFRQGDVRQFVRLPEVDSADGRGQLLRHKDFYRIDSLSSNYRTRSNIVEFNNRFFKSIVEGPFQDNAELQRLYIGDSTSDKPDLWQYPVKEGGYVAASFTDFDNLYAAVLEAVRHQVDDLHYDYGDIMILARKNDTLAEIADYFTKHAQDKPVPMVSSESFVLSNSNSVLLILSLFEYIYDRHNRVAALDALQLFLQNSSHSDVTSQLWQLRQNDFDLVALMAEYGVNFNPDRLITLSLYDCCESIIRDFNLQGRDTATLLNVVCDYEQRNGADLGSLISYLSDNLNKLSSSTASNLNAVSLMTIHKAKGLEAKIVIYAMPSKLKPNTKLWVEVEDKDNLGLPVAFVNLQKTESDFSDAFAEEYRLEEMDRINNLYVALTRPGDKLLLFCENRKKWSADAIDDISLIHSFATTDSQFHQKSQFQQDIYCIGEDFNKPPKEDDSSQDEDEEPNEVCIDTISFPTWERRISIAAQNKALFSSLQTDSRRYGIIVHDLLAHISTIEDVDSVVTDYCTENNISDDDASSIILRIKAMMQKVENQPYFNPLYKAKCEASIVVDGEVRRPDRIVFAPDRTWVVDFKTGAYNAESHSKYQKQVTQYASALTAMGYPDVEPVIIYL